MFSSNKEFKTLKKSYAFLTVGNSRFFRRRKEFADRITKYLKKAMGRQNLIYGRSEIDGYSLNEENGNSEDLPSAAE